MHQLKSLTKKGNSKGYLNMFKLNYSDTTFGHKLELAFYNIKLDNFI